MCGTTGIQINGTVVAFEAPMISFLRANSMASQVSVCSDLGKSAAVPAPGGHSNGGRGLRWAWPLILALSGISGGATVPYRKITVVDLVSPGGPIFRGAKLSSARCIPFIPSLLIQTPNLV